MILQILNGIFTIDYFLFCVKTILATYVTETPTLGLYNKIKVDITKELHNHKIYDCKVVCSKNPNTDINYLILGIYIKPTIISPASKWLIEMPLKTWENALSDRFTDDQLIDMYTQIPFVCTRIM